MRNICIFVLTVFCCEISQQSDLEQTSFIFYREQKSWQDAQSFCREKHIDLATITKEDDLFANGWYWIGLYRENNTSPWKWSNEDEEATFFNWHSFEPKEYQYCSDMINTEWHSENCEVEEYFVCFDEMLILVKKNKTWEEALDYCRSLGGEDRQNIHGKPRFDLATLTNDDDVAYARVRAQEATTDEVWTGLRFLGDSWFWMSGETVEYQNMSTCPSVSCGVLEKKSNTSFGIRDCGEMRNFFCYKTPQNS